MGHDIPWGEASAKRQCDNATSRRAGDEVEGIADADIEILLKARQHVRREQGLRASPVEREYLKTAAGPRIGSVVRAMIVLHLGVTEATRGLTVDGLTRRQTRETCTHVIRLPRPTDSSQGKSARSSARQDSLFLSPRASTIST